MSRCAASEWCVTDAVGVSGLVDTTASPCVEGLTLAPAIVNSKVVSWNGSWEVYCTGLAEPTATTVEAVTATLTGTAPRPV
jgi:hypothetical protein